MHQDTRNRLLQGAIIGVGLLGALAVTSMKDSFDKITTCRQSADCALPKTGAIDNTDNLNVVLVTNTMRQSEAPTTAP